MKKKDIDLSDIPEITEAQMAKAVLRVGGKPIERGKQCINLPLDSFVVEYFKAKATAGENAADCTYQSLINAALKEYIQNHNLEESAASV